LSTSVKKHESSKQHLTNILSLKRLENNTTTIKDALTEHSALSIKLPPLSAARHFNLFCFNFAEYPIAYPIPDATSRHWAGNFGGAAERKPVPIKPAEQPRARTIGQVSSSTTPRPGRLTTEKT
jgi:hypothetical protein